MQLAAASTAEYVVRHMLTTPVMATDLENLELALSTLPQGGLVLEFGVARGRTLAHMARLRPDVRFVGFDSWQGLPTDWNWMFPRGSFAQTPPRFTEPNIETRQGWFDDTLPQFLHTLDQPIDMIHMDMDQYSGCRTVLDHLRPHIRTGQHIVFDEYFNYPGWQTGEHQAWIEISTEMSWQWRYRSRTDHQQVTVEIQRAGT